MSRLIYTNEVGETLKSLIEEISPLGIFVLCDNNTEKVVYPQINQSLGEHHLITIQSGDKNKDLESAQHVWQQLIENGATRKSLLINVGGGVVTDLGGFVASTFKRGVRWINVPTTLLAAVDASVGGKTGINFMGLKNEVGVFSNPHSVLISTEFFRTLDRTELLSGYAEMIKHGLLTSTEALVSLLDRNISKDSISRPDFLEVLKENIRIKEDIVNRDPEEKGLRKALNLGHTIGHAIESLELSRGNAIPHGVAVAYGLVAETVLSHIKEGFPSSLLHHVALFVKENYPVPPIGCNDYEELLKLMRHDKKNDTQRDISFTLLRNPGNVLIDCVIEPDDIFTALDIMRDLLC